MLAHQAVLACPAPATERSDISDISELTAEVGIQHTLGDIYIFIYTTAYKSNNTGRVQSKTKVRLAGLGGLGRAALSGADCSSTS